MFDGKRFPARRTRKVRLVLIATGTLAASAQSAPAPSAAEVRQIREDCHTEGEAAGLEGGALQAFVDECVADLLSVELRNLSQD